MGVEADIEAVESICQHLKFGYVSSLPKGIDPETLNWNYPASRTVSFGINLTL